MQVTTFFLFILSILAAIILADDSSAERRDRQPADFPNDESFFRAFRSSGSANGKPTFIRFGKRAQPSFIRFGKRAQPSFIRFGRSSPDLY